MIREHILEIIENMRERENGFSSSTMRWSRWYIMPGKGYALFYSKKEKNKVEPSAIKLCDTTEADLDSLSDIALVDCFQALVRQTSKQM